MSLTASGPLVGLRVLEFASIGPGPRCATLLSDLRAEVLRIDRSEGNGWPNPIVDRGRATKVIDARSAEGCLFCTDAAASADVLIEGFRPGVMERLGLGPEDLCRKNDRLAGLCSDACVVPVLSVTSAPNHPHLTARETFVEAGGLLRAAPASRFSRTPGPYNARATRTTC